MNSIGDNCNELKKQYDFCFNTWFSEKFLKGKTDDTMCAPLFKIYQQCVKVTTKLISGGSDDENYFVNYFQDAMRDQHIEFKEIDSDHLGSDKEYKKPSS